MQYFKIEMETDEDSETDDVKISFRNIKTIVHTLKRDGIFDLLPKLSDSQQNSIATRSHAQNQEVSTLKNLPDLSDSSSDEEFDPSQDKEKVDRSETEPTSADEESDSSEEEIESNSNLNATTSLETDKQRVTRKSCQISKTWNEILQETEPVLSQTDAFLDNPEENIFNDLLSIKSPEYKSPLKTPLSHSQSCNDIDELFNQFVSDIQLQEDIKILPQDDNEVEDPNFDFLQAAETVPSSEEEDNNEESRAYRISIKEVKMLKNDIEKVSVPTENRHNSSLELITLLGDSPKKKRHKSDQSLGPKKVLFTEPKLPNLPEYDLSYYSFPSITKPVEPKEDRFSNDMLIKLQNQISQFTQFLTQTQTQTLDLKTRRGKPETVNMLLELKIR